jgi:DMSO/TMAO reductase YedYZ molybdopterin-dependent catalytic subunit
MISTLATTRRQFVGQLGVAGAVLMSGSALADPTIDLPLPSGPRERSITTAFPQKRAMILQRTRPPLLETPFEAFDNSVFTANDQFYVRWHWADIPTRIDVDGFRLQVRGHVSRAQSLTLDEIVNQLPRIDLPQSINAPAIRAATSSRASPGANGRTVPWATRDGPASA